MHAKVINNRIINYYLINMMLKHTHLLKLAQILRNVCIHENITVCCSEFNAV